MQVRVGQEHTTSAAFTLVELHLTDVQGLPIEQAHIFSHAYMTDMDMAVDQSSIKYLGEGNYRAQLRLYMAGPWAISIQAHAEGFDTLQQTLLIQVK